MGRQERLGLAELTLKHISSREAAQKNSELNVIELMARNEGGDNELSQMIEDYDHQSSVMRGREAARIIGRNQIALDEQVRGNLGEVLEGIDSRVMVGYLLQRPTKPVDVPSVDPEFKRRYSEAHRANFYLQDENADALAEEAGKFAKSIVAKLKTPGMKEAAEIYYGKSGAAVEAAKRKLSSQIADFQSYVVEDKGLHQAREYITRVYGDSTDEAFKFEIGYGLAIAEYESAELRKKEAEKAAKAKGK